MGGTKEKGSDKHGLAWTAMAWTLLAGSATCEAASRGPGSPIGPATSVPSSYGNDLVSQRDPMGPGGDLVMTGNVAGGMHFRGLVPYGSTTDFRASLGSTSLDSFLRSSEPATDSLSGWSAWAPFYSATASVTRTVPGSLDPIVPGAGRTEFGLPGGAMPARLDGPDLEPSQEDSTRTSWMLAAKPVWDTAPWVQANAFAGVSTRLYALTAQDTLSRAMSEYGQAVGQAADRPSDANRPMQGWLYGHRAYPDSGEGLQGQSSVQDPCGLAPWSSSPSRVGDGKPLAPISGSLEALNQKRYEQCMETAATLLKAGKAREASESYALASIYRPADTVALAGRSHALFMCGEYTSSALFLVRALDICPDYLRLPVDLAGGLGGEAALRTRVEEAGTYLRQEATPDLRLVLAYVCYRLGDMDSARRTLNGGPSSDRLGRAARALARAIDDSGQTSGR